MTSEKSIAAAGLSRAFFALAGLTWCLIAFGALVRAKQAGLACPDWPLCYGAVVPNLKLSGVIYEWGHRALAGGVSVLYFIGAAFILRDATLRPKLRAWVIGGGVLLLTQIVFGGLTVLIVHRGDGAARPAAWTVATHLILGNSFAALSYVTALRLRDVSVRSPQSDGSPMGAADSWLARLWTASLLLQFGLGGAIAGNIAGLVCTEFPTCNAGIWFPSWTGFVGLQIFHRLNAYLLLALATTLTIRWRRRTTLWKYSLFILLACIAQAAVGALNIASYLHAAVTTLHSALAALLFSATAALTYERTRRCAS